MAFTPQCSAATTHRFQGRIQDYKLGEHEVNGPGVEFPRNAEAFLYKSMIFLLLPYL